MGKASIPQAALHSTQTECYKIKYFQVLRRTYEKIDFCFILMNYIQE